MRNTERTIIDILSLLLAKDIRQGEAVLKDSEPAWDSMKHIEIILTIEENLDISFEPEDIPTLTSLEKIVAKAKELYVE